METMAHSYAPCSPQIQTSHLCEARPTRTMQAPESRGQHLSAPASQESILSVDSYGSSVGPRLQSNSINLTQPTNYTDLTSPMSSAPGPGSQEQAFGAKQGGDARARTPEDQIRRADRANALASPMSIVSPMSTNGKKRTASGHVKNAPSLPATPLASALSGGRSRAESTSSTSSRASELAMSLKTRLGYAMTKVHNGWEQKTFEQVEQLAAQSPKRHSISHADYSTRPVSSGLSNVAARLSMYESNGVSSLDGALFPPSKRHSGQYQSYSQSHYRPANGATPCLQPAPDIRPTNGSRHYLAPFAQHAKHSNAMSPPRTPISTARRPPTIRTDTQTAEAERDALQALYQLGSPRASQGSHNFNPSRASSSQASPLRSEITTPRRVTFARSESDQSSARPSSSDGSVQEARQRALEDLEDG